MLRADITDPGGNGGSAFGYKLAGSYLHTSSCQQRFNISWLILNTRGGNRDSVNEFSFNQRSSQRHQRATRMPIGRYVAGAPK